MYDLVKLGYKREIYRETSPYWKARIATFCIPDGILLVYADRRPQMACKAARIVIRGGRPDWGAEVGVRYIVFVLEGQASPVRVISNL